MVELIINKTFNSNQIYHILKLIKKFENINIQILKNKIMLSVPCQDHIVNLKYLYFLQFYIKHFYLKQLFYLIVEERHFYSVFTFFKRP